MHGHRAVNDPDRVAPLLGHDAVAVGKDDLVFRVAREGVDRHGEVRAAAALKRHVVNVLDLVDLLKAVELRVEAAHADHRVAHQRLAGAHEAAEHRGVHAVARVEQDLRVRHRIGAKFVLQDAVADRVAREPVIVEVHRFLQQIRKPLDRVGQSRVAQRAHAALRCRAGQGRNLALLRLSLASVARVGGARVVLLLILGRVGRLQCLERRVNRLRAQRRVLRHLLRVRGEGEPVGAQQLARHGLGRSGPELRVSPLPSGIVLQQHVQHLAPEQHRPVLRRVKLKAPAVIEDPLPVVCGGVHLQRVDELRLAEKGVPLRIYLQQRILNGLQLHMYHRFLYYRKSAGKSKKSFLRHFSQYVLQSVEKADILLFTTW